MTARVREARNHPGLDGVASVHYDNRYAGRALHGGERGGIPASDKEIDLIGDHSIHRIVLDGSQVISGISAKTNPRIKLSNRPFASSRQNEGDANDTGRRQHLDARRGVERDRHRDLHRELDHVPPGRRFHRDGQPRGRSEPDRCSIAKRAAEKRLESSSIDYTILLPSYFAETWFSPAVGFDTGNGKIRIYGDGSAKVSYVALEDVAKALIASLDNPKASRKAIPIGGPKAISQLDAVALFEKATGRKMSVEFMTADQIAGARKDTKDSLMGSFLGLFELACQGRSGSLGLDRDAQRDAAVDGRLGLEFAEVNVLPRPQRDRPRS